MLVAMALTKATEKNVKMEKNCLVIHDLLKILDSYVRIVIRR